LKWIGRRRGAWRPGVYRGFEETDAFYENWFDMFEDCGGSEAPLLVRH
jgi:hypothetical protein